METNSQLDQLVLQIQTKLDQALSSLMRKSINLNLRQNGLIKVTEAQRLLENIPGQVTAVYIPIVDEVGGDIFVFLPNELANNIADLLIGNEIGVTTIIGEFEGSALKEFGNITFGVIVTEIANSLKLPMMLTVPNLATGMANALLDRVLIEHGMTSMDMLAIQMPFNIEGLSGEGNFLITFDKQSSDMIQKQLEIEQPINGGESDGQG